MSRERLAILGVGLLGGSVALAARTAGVVEEVIGYDPRPEALAFARQGGLVDRSSRSVRGAVARASLVVVCAPVDRIVAQVIEAAEHCPGETILTDVGSTKGLVREVEGKLPPGRVFIGGHPLAGSEKSGPENASADLFRDRLVILTTTESTPQVAVERLAGFWNSLGARIGIMTPEDHDRAVAWTSHLPHLIAYALAGCLPPELQPLTATGFRDMTRLAGSAPDLWRAIFEANREAILAALGGFRDHLAALETALLDGNEPELESLLRLAQARVR
jgi:prephenate dehydrogenase